MSGSDRPGPSGESQIEQDLLTFLNNTFGRRQDFQELRQQLEDEGYTSFRELGRSSSAASHQSTDSAQSQPGAISSFVFTLYPDILVDHACISLTLALTFLT